MPPSPSIDAKKPRESVSSTPVFLENDAIDEKKMCANLALIRPASAFSFDMIERGRGSRLKPARTMADLEQLRSHMSFSEPSQQPESIQTITIITRVRSADSLQGEARCDAEIARLFPRPAVIDNQHRPMNDSNDRVFTATATRSEERRNGTRSCSLHTRR